MEYALEAHIVPGVCCIACGYDLQKLPLGGKCPECGTDVAGSVKKWESELRKGSPWGIADYVILAGLILCTLTLLGRAMEGPCRCCLSGIQQGFAWPAFFAFGYLCVRFRPLGRNPGRRLRRMIPLLILLVIGWALLVRDVH
jgi:hypothetical protein